MTITFKTIPASLRAPGVYGEIDPSRANASTVNQPTLIIGQMLASGTATANVPVLVTSYDQARTTFGAGSMLSLMYKKYREADAFGTVYVLPLADNAAGTQASNTITITGTATAAGTLNVYVAGTNIQVGVAAGDANTAVAAALNAAINAAIDLPATSSVSTNVVNVTARHKGIAAGDIDLRVNYGGPAAGEFTPTGVTVAIGAGTAGTGEPVLNFTALADTAYAYICTPYTDSTSVGAVSTLLNDTVGRWSPFLQLYGHAFSAKEATVGNLSTFGNGLNDQHLTVLGFNDAPEPVYLWAAAYTGVCAQSLSADPALPLQNIALPVKAPAKQSRFSLTERNTLYFDGISTTRINDAGQVILDRSVTTYQTNTTGAPDSSYLDTETLATLQVLLRDVKDMLSVKFGRVKLVQDGTSIPAGSNTVTAQIIKGEVIGWYRNQVNAGLAQDAAGFARGIVAENQGNGVVALLLPIAVANQLRITKLLVQFTKP
ncbi:phage tail sheath subtilisin-like domain-containing protein [Paracraurococcus lichenis]|uniref:Phage tail sheath subtilisin-like domain-containing protein n=1 Tax=Paracraurococcus lichenis TaxID=3064888 RepID=A0ABT9EEK1_9PROT|nr:phage tail sheath subtilisin-like domain-containing protein [Paracraurococcus sp. LOR1-02]MDO9714300.1 phage tail sheath subtilisin-like domain-containing protein [Paracraurococcus sp. LOR1-02]